MRFTSAAAQDLKHSVANLESRLAAQESANTDRFGRIEARLDEHASKLADVPTLSQIVTATERLLSCTMSSVDERLATETLSIEVLKTTVSQTDNLLERVLESLDSLRADTDSADPAVDAPGDPPAVEVKTPSA